MKWKRQTAVGIAGMLVLLGVTRIVSGQQPGVILYENFDNVPIGEIPDGWVKTEIGEVGVAAFPSDADRSLRFLDGEDVPVLGATAGAGARLTFSPQSRGVFSVEYTLLRVKSVGAQGVEILYVVGSGGDQPFNGVSVAMFTRANGGFFYADGGVWQDGKQEMADNEWHRFKYVIDMNRETWTLIHNGEVINAQINFRGKTGGLLDTIRLMDDAIDNEASFEIYFSEIMVYKGDQRPAALAVAPANRLATRWGVLKAQRFSSSANESRRLP